MRPRPWIALAAVAAMAACGGEPPRAPGALRQESQGSGAVELTGAGSTFVYPLFARWFAAYAEHHPVRVNYQSIGSGGGIRQFLEGTVDFGATDVPLSDAERARAPGALVLPVVAGSVAITYNLPQIKAPLRLDGPTLAAIFLGVIRRWDDPRLRALNPGLALPARDILVVHRTDGSGTTAVFTAYLSQQSPEWRQRVGQGTSVRWPVGLGAKGNEGVTNGVRQTEGAVGYVEQIYARQNRLPMAEIRNRAGEFVAPSREAVEAALATVDVPANGDLRLSLLDRPGQGVYPIAGFTFLLARQHMDDCRKAKALVEVFLWALTDGDALARELGYAPLGPALDRAVQARLRSITCGPQRQPTLSTR